MNNDTKYADVNVRIPNLDGDAIAEMHTVRVPVAVDPHTGEEILTEEAVGIIETTKARYMGLLLPAEMKKMREQLGLTQRRISELVQSGEKSWTRWESGKARPSRMVNVLLRLMYEGKVFITDLVAQRKPGTNWRNNCCPKMSHSKVTVTKATFPTPSITQMQVCGTDSGLSPPSQFIYSCLLLTISTKLYLHPFSVN
ncbi:MAG TPA: type II toxin-antitoxin system MqsA family antitoxin [Verrucomicrobiae bacterium]|jgi:DNA-binding transcriptional regulator YiaG|nr:type II toxin-antitoxin system MqsA family antitoxin [Verrucomicrobiae bacterium]